MKGLLPKGILVGLCLVVSAMAYGQELPIDKKTNRISYKGTRSDTAKIEYDLKLRVREWLKETAKANHARGFSYNAEKNQFTGDLYTTLKIKDKLGADQLYPLYCTFTVSVIESAILKESTFKYELTNFEVLSSKKKYYPAEKLLIKGESEGKDPLPTDALAELQLQAATFIDEMIASFHKKMLNGAVAQK